MDNYKNSQSDEIDLGQLLNMIKKAFASIFKWWLRVFIYLRKNAIKLGILIVIGAVVGFGLKQLTSRSLKVDVIVKPNGDSVDYLYDVVEEISTNLKVQDTAFFNALEIDRAQVDNLEIFIEPIEKEERVNMEEKVQYLEALEKFRGDPVISDIVRAEIQGNTMLNHKISFHFKDANFGRKAAERIINYINSNPYYVEYTEISHENARERIKQNTKLIEQIDTVVSAYASKIRMSPGVDNRITVAEDESLDLPGLLNLKNVLLRDIELKRLELQGEKEAIRVINFGATQQVIRSFFFKPMVLVPLILIVLFILSDFLKYLNRKADEIIG